MSDDSNNLLTALYRWSPRQGENFTTEAFAHLLRHYAAHEPETAAGLLGFLTNGLFRTPEDAEEVTISTQSTEDEGRPDMEIRSMDRLAYVEVKTGSGLGQRQLSRYRQALGRFGKKTCLALLTGGFVEIREGVPDVWLRWHEMADRLDTFLKADHWSDTQSAYLTRQFLGYLKERSLTMENVGWELVRGVEALRSLIGLLTRVVEGLGTKNAFRSAWDGAGYYIDRTRCWIGLGYEKPGHLRFVTQRMRLDLDRARSLGKGNVEKESWCPGGYKWVHELDLESEEVHFFALKKDGQMRAIQRFLEESLELAKKIEKQ